MMNNNSIKKDTNDDIWRFGRVNANNPNAFGLKRSYDRNLSSVMLYRCLLCNHNTNSNVEDGIVSSHMTKYEWNNHTKEPYHSQLVEQLKAEQEECIDELLKLDKAKCDYHRLGFLPDSNKKLILKWLNNGKPSSPSSSKEVLYEITELKKELDVRKTNYYYNRDPRRDVLIQLELVLWKTACLVNPPAELMNEEDSAATISSLVTYLVRGGWKKHKVLERYNSMIGIVINNVFPFLSTKRKHNWSHTEI